jgi:hypothetical protein
MMPENIKWSGAHLLTGRKAIPLQEVALWSSNCATQIKLDHCLLRGEGDL